MEKRILAIICTHNPNDKGYDESFENFTHPWFNCIKSWQAQNDEGMHVDIIVADNVSGSKTRAKLLEYQSLTKNLCVVFTDQYFTSPFLCFNHALHIIRNKDKYDYFAYCASDANFMKAGDLRMLIRDMESNSDCCFISPQADHDMVQKYCFNPNKESTKVHLGEGVNNHLFVCSNEFMKAYDYKYIDIIGGPRSESLNPFLCSAIGRCECLSHKVIIHHIGRLDANSRSKSQPLLINLYKRDFFKMLNNGNTLGLGFEECLQNRKVYENIFTNTPNLRTFKLLFIKAVVLNKIFKLLFYGISSVGLLPSFLENNIRKALGEPYYHRHNPKFFDSNEHVLSKDLYHFVKNNLFLTKEELDYAKIPHRVYKCQGVI